MSTETTEQDAGVASLKTSDVARMLNVSTGHVVKLVASNTLPFFNVGIGQKKAYRFRKEDIEQFIRKRLEPIKGAKPKTIEQNNKPVNAADHAAIQKLKARGLMS